MQKYNPLTAWRLFCAGLKCFPALSTEEYHRLRLRKAFLAFLQGSEMELANLAPQYMVANYDRFARLQAEALGYWAIVLQHKSNPVAALEYYKRALRIRVSLKDEIGIMKLLINLGTCLRDLEEFAKANKVLTAVQKKLGTDKAHRRLYLCSCLEKGRLCFRAGDIPLALGALNFTLQNPDSKIYPDVCADCFRELARIYWQLQSIDESQESYRKALAGYVKHGFVGKAKSLREEFADRF